MASKVMKLYIFRQSIVTDENSAEREHVSTVCHRIAKGTDTSELVCALYFLPGIRETRGVYIRRWTDPHSFRTGRGKWRFTQAFPLPADLPDQFRLIRMRLDDHPKAYPREERDVYGWQFRYQNFEDHLATLFAHELHHYRRYHLNLHVREGEHGANRWALSRVQALDFHVSGQKLRKKPVRKPVKWFKPDPYKAFRDLKQGDRLTINNDPRHRYTGQYAIVVRPIRSNSKRVVIETSDGKQWRWPMNWLTL